MVDIVTRLQDGGFATGDSRFFEAVSEITNVRRQRDESAKEITNLRNELAAANEKLREAHDQRDELLAALEECVPALNDIRDVMKVKAVIASVKGGAA